MHARQRLRIETSDSGFDAAFAAAAEHVLGSVIDVPPFGRTAGALDAPPHVPSATHIAAAALLLGSPESAAITLETCAACIRAHGGALPEGFTTPRATPDDFARTALFARLAERYLAATGELGLMTRLWPVLRAAAAPEAVDAIGEAIGEVRHPTQPSGLVSIDAPPRPHAPSPPALDARQRSPAPHDRGAERAGAATMHAADLVLHAVEGSLGFRPDAPRQRVTLEPQLTGAWRAVHADELSVGDAGVQFACVMSDARVTLTIEQTSGAVPLRCVLRAMLPVQRVHAVLINGVAVSVDLQQHDDCTVLPVQLSLDDEKIIAIIIG